MYTVEKIKELRTAAKLYKMDAPKQFWNGHLDFMQRVCNGAGPERWDIGKRQALTNALCMYEAAFAIHDVDYEIQKDTRKKADKTLRKNMLKVWRKTFGWKRWLSRTGRIERLVVIPTVYAAVTLGGEDAWEEARVQKKARKNKRKPRDLTLP